MVFPDKNSFMENVSLSHQTVARRVYDISANIEDTLVQRLSGCEFYSLALDESADISDTTELAVFVRGVAKTFDVVEELLDICPLKGTTTGKDVFAKVNQVHCPVLSSRPTDAEQHKKYSDLVTKFSDDFEQRLQNFRKHIGTMKIISNHLIK